METTNFNDRNMMDWNDSLVTDGQEFITLDEGDYNFVVTGFERGRYPGSEKIPTCNKAILTLAVHTDDGKLAIVKLNLILYRSLEWRISGFFRCIGQKKRGERLVMDWNKVLGSKGRAHFTRRSYIGRDGEEHQTNDVERFYDYDSGFFMEAGALAEDDMEEELPFN